MKLATFNLYEEWMFIIYLCEAWHRGSKLMPFFLNSNISIIEKGYVSNFFHSFKVIPMKLATSNPHEESMFITNMLWDLTLRFQSYVPFRKTLIFTSRESVTIFFYSFQVINMIFFMFWLIFYDKEGIGGIFITMNDSSILFDIQTNFSKQLFVIYNKLLSSLKMVHGSSKIA